MLYHSGYYLTNIIVLTKSDWYFTLSLHGTLSLHAVYLYNEQSDTD